MASKSFDDDEDDDDLPLIPKKLRQMAAAMIAAHPGLVNEQGALRYLLHNKHGRRLREKYGIAVAQTLHLSFV